MLQSLDIDLLANGKRVQLDLLIGATSCIKPLHRVNLEHIPQVVLLFLSAIISKAVGI